MTHIWTSLPAAQPHTRPWMSSDCVIGLGFILSCGYWCTDFSSFNERSPQKHRRLHQYTALRRDPKLVLPTTRIVPGMAAAVFFRRTSTVQYDQALPFVMQHYYGYSLLGLGISAILASLMSGLAGNITAFSAVWTHDLYRAIHQTGPKRRSLFAMSAGYQLRSHACSQCSHRVYRIPLQQPDGLSSALIFPLQRSIVCHVPPGNVHHLGDAQCWILGILSGVLVAAAHNLGVHYGVIVYGSQMLANFYGAIYGWTACMAITAHRQHDSPKPRPWLN